MLRILCRLFHVKPCVPSQENRRVCKKHKVKITLCHSNDQKMLSISPAFWGERANEVGGENINRTIYFRTPADWNPLRLLYISQCFTTFLSDVSLQPHQMATCLYHKY